VYGKRLAGGSVYANTHAAIFSPEQPTQFLIDYLTANRSRFEKLNGHEKPAQQL
jgi:hypothetical protein